MRNIKTSRLGRGGDLLLGFRNEKLVKFYNVVIIFARCCCNKHHHRGFVLHAAIAVENLYTLVILARLPNLFLISLEICRFSDCDTWNIRCFRFWTRHASACLTWRFGHRIGLHVSVLLLAVTRQTPHTTTFERAYTSYFVAAIWESRLLSVSCPYGDVSHSGYHSVCLVMLYDYWKKNLFPRYSGWGIFDETVAWALFLSIAAIERNKRSGGTSFWCVLVSSRRVKNCRSRAKVEGSSSGHISLTVPFLMVFLISYSFYL